MMHRRTVTVLAVVALATLSGCAGFLGSEPPRAGTGSPASADAPVHEVPLDETAVLDAHEAALNNVSTFQYRSNASKRLYDSGIPPITTNKTVRLNRTTGETFVDVRNRLSPSRQVYLDGSGTAYMARQVNATEVEYGTVDPDAVDTSTYHRPPIDPYLAGLTFTHDGTDTVDGATVDVYTVSNTSQLNRSAHGLEEISPSNLDRIEVTLAVDRDGLIRSFDYAAEGSNSQGDRLGFFLSLRYSGVGSTTVERPAWTRTNRTG